LFAVFCSVESSGFRWSALLFRFSLESGLAQKASDKERESKKGKEEREETGKWKEREEKHRGEGKGLLPSQLTQLFKIDLQTSEIRKAN
jgi:hypothetical protein